MKIIQVSEATNLQLDWLVAKCEEDELAMLNIQYPDMAKHYPKVSPSTDWAQGGQIVEREKIGTTRVDTNPDIWAAHITDPWRAASNVYSRLGDTPLIAAMRCYVASKLGDTVEIPEELLK